MYDIVTVKCGSIEQSVILSTIDKRVLSVIKERLQEEDLKILQDVFLRSHKTRARSIARGHLVQAIGSVLDAIKEEGDRLAFIYGVSYKDEQFVVSGPGTTSGLRISGDSSYFYSLKTGVGRCNLEKWGADPTGRGYVVETIDYRERESLVTENKGEIKLKKRKLALTLPALLTKLLSALEAVDCEMLLFSYLETIRRPGG